MPLKVYYLDDEQALLVIFSETFASELVQITTFADPVVALDVIRSAPPDLLFLDYRLPKITGLEIAQQLDPAIPKILVTGDLMSVEKVAVIAIIEKPIKVGEVQSVIESFLKLQQAE